MSLHTMSRGPARAGLLAMGFVLSLVLATTAQAAPKKYSLSGNTRAQIGGGLPLPVTTAAPPVGKIKLTPNAYVFQTTGPDPKQMTFVGTPSPLFSNVKATQPVWFANNNVFQVRTSLIVNGPFNATATNMLGTAMFAAGGRTGPATFNWCPGLTPPTAVDPGCTDPLAPPGTVIFPARVTFRALGAQFGGPSQALVGAAGTKGGASVVLNAGGAVNTASCLHPNLGGADPSCLGGFSAIAVASHAVGGRAISTGQYTTAPPSQPGNIHPVGVTINGQVTQASTAHTNNFGTLTPNSVLSYGFPYTTGTVEVSAPTALNGAEIFTLIGSDNRVDGLGSISLVTGGVSLRTVSGANANRGWLNYVIPGGANVPSISTGGLMLLSMLMLGATVWMVRRATV